MERGGLHHHYQTSLRRRREKGRRRDRSNRRRRELEIQLWKSQSCLGWIGWEYWPCSSEFWPFHLRFPWSFELSSVMKLLSGGKIASWVLHLGRWEEVDTSLPQTWVLHVAATILENWDTYHLDGFALIDLLFVVWWDVAMLREQKWKGKSHFLLLHRLQHQNGRSQCKQAVLFNDLYWNCIFPTGPQSLQYLADFESAECKSFPLLSSFSNNLWPVLSFSISKQRISMRFGQQLG